MQRPCTCKNLACAHTVARPAKREEWGHDLLPLRVPHRLIKASSGGSERQWLPERLLSIAELIKVFHNEVDYQHQPGANAQSEQHRPHSALRT